MNMDDGRIVMWDNLTQQERDSGRWVKLTEGEHARAITLEEHERRQDIDKIFGRFAETDAEASERMKAALNERLRDRRT